MAEEEQDREVAEDAWSVDSADPSPRDDGRRGPPDDWPYPSWYDRQDNDWWWRYPNGWRADPCPAQALGAVDGEYIFITPFGERRRFTSGQLHGRGGLVDLFGGSLWWALKHFTKWEIDPESGKGAFKGGLQGPKCIAALIRCALRAGYYDESRPPRGVGTWREDGKPVVHVGDRIFHDGRMMLPGVQIGDDVYVRGGAREAPAHRASDRFRSFSWLPAEAAEGRIVGDHLGEWAWTSPEARDLFHGALHCNMLGSLLLWLPHVFVQAPYGSGKSLLLKYARTLLGGASHNVQRNYSRAHFEQNFEGTALCFPVDETESDSEPDRIRKIIEFVRLLSDDGATGGRGTASGKGRTIDVHGAMLMAATITEEWLPQDRSRITLLELLSFRDRSDDHPPAPPETLAAIFRRAGEMSPALRARALTSIELFHQNLKVAREAILRMRGQPRDADQLGHLIAGWRTMTCDAPLDPERHEEITRFRPFVVSLQEADDGEDEPSELLNLLFGLAPDVWKGGSRRTIGQLIALGREPEGSAAREDLLPFGLRLERGKDASWDQAWLLVANKHAGLDDLFEKAKKNRYVGKKRSTILKQLRLIKDGVELGRAVPGEESGSTRLRFAGQQSRYLMIPPVFLPSVKDESR